MAVASDMHVLKDTRLLERLYYKNKKALKQTVLLQQVQVVLKVLRAGNIDQQRIKKAYKRILQSAQVGVFVPLHCVVLSIVARLVTLSGERERDKTQALLYSSEDTLIGPSLNNPTNTPRHSLESSSLLRQIDRRESHQKSDQPSRSSSEGNELFPHPLKQQSSIQDLGRPVSRSNLTGSVSEVRQPKSEGFKSKSKTKKGISVGEKAPSASESDEIDSLFDQYQ